MIICCQLNSIQFNSILGDDSKYLYIIESGRFTVTVNHKAELTSHLSSGDCFGEATLLRLLNPQSPADLLLPVQRGGSIQGLGVEVSQGQGQGQEQALRQGQRQGRGEGQGQRLSLNLNLNLNLDLNQSHSVAHVPATVRADSDAALFRLDCKAFARQFIPHSTTSTSSSTYSVTSEALFARRQEEIISCLCKVPLLSGLSSGQIKRLAEGVELVPFSTGNK
jgi:CRP-like cAMP-binding protein